MIEPNEAVWDQRWQDAWQLVGVPAPLAVLPALLAAYREPQRHYHTLQHLDECWKLLEAAPPVAAPGALRLALWFHDAVYQPQRADNEARSAVWAEQVLLAAGVDAACCQHVVTMIHATRQHQDPPDETCAQLFDLDLAILAAAEPRLTQYEQQIRQEYAWVPEALFQQTRRGLVAEWLARPYLYATEWGRATLEQPARANLRRLWS